jgi:hypothetical protein
MTAQHRIASSSPSPSTLCRPSGGKLATGDAATLGMMVFYNWHEKRLAKTDPEGHARLQRLKALFRAGAPDAAQETNAKRTISQPLHYKHSARKNTGISASH